jgi:hypothetical protein
MRFQSPLARITKIASMAIGTILTTVVNSDGGCESNAINKSALNQNPVSIALLALNSFATLVTPK